MFLRLLVIATLSLAPSASGSTDAADPLLRDGGGLASALPRPSILLFWAIWCAPCRAEVRDLTELAAAADGVPLVVVPVDSDRRTRRELAHLEPRAVRYVEGDGLAFMRRWSDSSAALPVAAALDREGKRCAVKLGQLTVSDIIAWRHACRWDAPQPR